MRACQQAREAKPWAHRFLSVLIVVIAAFTILAFIQRPLRIWYMIHRVEAAQGPQEEREAFALVQRYTPGWDGYSVRLFGADEAEIQIRTSSDYEKIHYVEIRWEGGYFVKKHLSEAGNTGILMYE